jgi:hypothetical protein
VFELDFRSKRTKRLKLANRVGHFVASGNHLETPPRLFRRMRFVDRFDYGDQRRIFSFALRKIAFLLD